MDAAVRGKVLAIYREADAAVAAHAPVCEASGRCCRFTEYGHALYLSELEAEVLLDTAPPFAGPATPSGCPFQVEGLCVAREERPLGCRVYFCDPTFQEAMPGIIERGIRQLKELTDAEARPWRYAPLHEFLNEAPPDRPNARRPLPVV